MRILFVAMQHSVHTARWIDQIAGCGWDLHLFPVDHQPLHAELHNLTVHPLIRVPAAPDAVRQTGLRWPTSRGLVTGRGLLEALPVPWTNRSTRLAKAIKSLKPDLIHVLHMQHAGYLLTEAAHDLPTLPPVIYSSWGSDFYYYGELDTHREKIRRFVSLCDYHIADCERDVGLAKKFGFTGKSLGVFPVSGGFDLPAVRALAQPGPPSARRVIALKGYHEPQWAGRALVGMHALVECRDALRDYEIEVFAASDNTRHVADFVTRALGMRVRVMPPSGNRAVLELLGRARMSIGLSITDGTPISLLEAMIMGALPIQSDTVSTAEWIRDGETGLLVPAEDAAAVARAIRHALADDALVDSAAEQNAAIVDAKLPREPIAERVRALYEQVAAGPSRTRPAATPSLASPRWRW